MLRGRSAEERIPFLKIPDDRLRSVHPVCKPLFRCIDDQQMLAAAHLDQAAVPVCAFVQFQLAENLRLNGDLRIEIVDQLLQKRILYIVFEHLTEKDTVGKAQPVGGRALLRRIALDPVDFICCKGEGDSLFLLRTRRIRTAGIPCDAGQRFGLCAGCQVDDAAAADRLRTDRMITGESLPAPRGDTAVICGSDQIWNKRIVGDVAPYLLKGVPKDCVKASYAASLSVVERSDYESAETLDALKDFDFISVREAGSQRMLSSLGLEVKTVVDPVFLPTASYWKQFGKKPQSVAPDERYAVMYLLRDDADCIERAERYARKQNIRLFTVHPLNRRVRSKSAQLIADADPREFVWLIEHADAVFTNSFHATSFSAIFEKKLMYLHQKELGERAADLLGTVRVTPADDDLVTVSCENSTGFTERKAISTEFIDSVFRAAKERENN